MVRAPTLGWKEALVYAVTRVGHTEVTRGTKKGRITEERKEQGKCTITTGEEKERENAIATRKEKEDQRIHFEVFF